MVYGRQRHRLLPLRKRVDATHAAIYTDDLASRQFSEVIRLTDEAIGNLSISPDGDQIVFERAPRLFEGTDNVRHGPRLLCPCSLWLVGRNGSNLRKLADDGRQPAWSPRVIDTSEPSEPPTPRPSGISALLPIINLLLE